LNTQRRVKHRGLVAAVFLAAVVYVISGCASAPTYSMDSVAYIDAPIAFDEALLRADAIANSGLGQDEPANDLLTVEDQLLLLNDYTPAIVSARGVHLRKRPRTGSRSLGKTIRGQELKVHDIRKDGWCEVETLEGVRGYVWAPLLDIEGRKFRTAKYKGMTHILISSNYYLGPDGKKRSRLEVRGLKLTPPLLKTALTSRFGIRKRHPVNGGRNKMHQGVDLKADIGTPVMAAAKGIVKSVVQGPNYGIYIDIRHKLGVVTRYAHLGEVFVRKGDRIQAGAVIARSGNTGATTGPHLHFELHKRGRALRPSRHVPGLY